MDENKNRYEDNVQTIKVHAGNRRTYFFDIKKSKNEDYYITITENTKKLHSEFVEKHRIILYREDFNKFVQAMNNTVNSAKELMPHVDFEKYAQIDAEWEAKREARKNEEGSSDDMNW